MRNRSKFSTVIHEQPLNQRELNELNWLESVFKGCQKRKSGRGYERKILSKNLILSHQREYNFSSPSRKLKAISNLITLILCLKKLTKP